jgi:hypothetical protein
MGHRQAAHIGGGATVVTERQGTGGGRDLLAHRGRQIGAEKREHQLE